VDLRPLIKGNALPLLANWFTGVLIVPRGQPREESMGPFGAEYDNYVVLVVRRGLVVSRTELDEVPR